MLTILSAFNLFDSIYSIIAMILFVAFWAGVIYLVWKLVKMLKNK